ncbi:COQ9 family protein [Albimonas sp. CAU 1670]|uniref:COQ9 family protein n=1 Tax=Albimonas sp. CAU 1670 TaxID=3032599 RepID=UPI0023D9BA5F|nr:COQ9 family protein [Albimonas sp. CAU 1670]MDF2233332.1 COQ9 family protein [Albimonas sp. CAU 1670]
MSLPEHDAPAAETATAPGATATAAEGASGLDAVRAKLLEKLPEHVQFDGWSRAAIDMAAVDADVPEDVARMAFPTGVDAAAAFHALGDRRMLEALSREPLGAMGMTAKITLAIRLRLESVSSETEKEAVRRAASLFALPTNTARGARLIWATADAIWTALGDESDDLNWYSKRATLSAVISSTVLYWLGDDSEGAADTWAYLDRRISDVMKIEKAKARMRANPLGRMATSGVEALSRGLKKAPRRRAGG